MKQIALVGKPNSGKSSLFNLITGLRQKIGNFNGVTVEKKTGTFGENTIIDLPGLKSLKSVSPEERISKDAILSYTISKTGVLFVANGMQLEDSLMLFSEIADLQVPMALVINFSDDVEKNNIKIDIEGLANKLGCRVVLMNSRKGTGIEELKEILNANDFKIPNAVARSHYDEIINDEISNTYLQSVSTVEKEKSSFANDDFHKRQKIITAINSTFVKRNQNLNFLENSKKWDKILLHPIYGLIIFLAVMYLVFQSVFSFSSIPMDWIDASMAALTDLAKNNLPAGWVNDLISDAIIQGIGGVVIFIPQIAILFFFLGVLEHTGYLSRISYISDAFLRKFGLSGKSVIPLMSSWACSIPAIMSTRVINDPKERMAVIMASPLMTCSARLPVYTILIAVLIPQQDAGFLGGQGLALLGLYLLGVIATLTVAWFISSRSKIEANPFWSLELPVYRMPNWKSIFIVVYQKTKSFVIQAGKIILAISILLWILSTNSPKTDQFVETQYQTYQDNNPNSELSKDAFDLEYSYLGYIGKFIEPTISPLGYDWKIGIALISSFAAREVFVGTLSTIYSIGSEEEESIVARLKNEKIIGTQKPRFDVPTGVSLLLFYVFALQCMSTLAIVRKETGAWKYAIWQFIFMLILAYFFAFAAYQLL